MFCPRCGRPVSPTANFCGGCGLPRAEIEKSAQPQDSTQPVQPVQEVPTVDINELNTTLSQLEGDLTGINPVENYTTDTTINTNTEMSPQADIVEEIRLSVENQAEGGSAQHGMENPSAGYQSEFSRNAPQHPYYSRSVYTQSEPQPKPVQQHITPQEQTMSTVDFVWMLLISSIPIIGMIYVIYMAFVQKDNAIKRSWARATLILYVFSFVVALVFAMGIVMTQFMYW